MARPRVTRQELNRRKLARGFVGRTEKLTMFRDNLGRHPQDDDFQYLFHVHGNAGVGKTSLVRQWEAAAQAREAATVYLDDDVHDPLEVMEAVSVQLERQGLPLRAFKELLATYRQRRHEAETAPPSPGTADPSASGQQASATGTVLAQAGVMGLGMLPVPGAGALAGFLDPQHVAQQLDHGADRLRAMVASRLRSHDDVQLVVSPLQVLTPVFLQDLTRAAERRPWVVLFFDVFERTGPLLNTWLPDVLIGVEHGTLPPNVIAVLSGQGRLDARHWGDHRRLIWDVPLEVFTEDEARDLLADHGITDEQVVEVILRLTGRLPVLVDLLAQTRPQGPTDIEDPADTAVDRFLKWITDPARRDAALACALPLQLNEDVYRAAVPEAAADQYTWLRGLPFVIGREGRARYHDVVRAPMLRLQRTRSAARWQQQHLRLADAYQRWRQDRGITAAHGAAREDPDGYDHRLNETYHRLCANPLTAWADTLAHLVDACDGDTAVLRRWAQILIQAGQDAQHPALTDWGSRLQAAAGEDTNGNVAALTQLLTAPELSHAGRALAHTLRGRDHRVAGRYDQALTDYATALSLDPDLARAHYGRGETHRLAQRYDQALISLDRAVELEPADPANIWSRAQTYRDLERFDEALADLSRAIELEPDNAWALASRGQTYRSLRRFDEALADLGRAAELEPRTAWIIADRGETHRRAENYDEALADLGRAIELEPDDAWALASRGQTYRSLRRFDEALADLSRSIELDPPYVTFSLVSRGQTYQGLGRYDEALADFDRAVVLTPDDDWAVANRGENHRLAKNYDRALSDFDRAIELDPAYAWAIASRGQTYRHLGRYDQALTDLDRAIELTTAYAWMFADRGETHRLARNYDEALSDFGRAIELEPDHAWSLASRGQAYCGLERYDEALADFGRAIELEPDKAWALAGRGRAYRSLGRYDEALTDLNRAIGLEGDAGHHCETALVMHLLGRTEEREHWRAARSLFAADASAGGPLESESRGNLMLVHCAMGEWTEAVEELSRFLGCRPVIWTVRDALENLAELEAVLSLDSAALQSFRQKLDDVERELQGRSGPGSGEPEPRPRTG